MIRASRAPTRPARAGPLLGAHVPAAGGLPRAAENGRAIRATAIQVFTRNQVQWRARPIADEEAAAFGRALAKTGIRMVVAHGSYLVNLASPDAELLRKSRDAFAAELERCRALGIPYLIFHPGAHMGAGERAGLRAIADSLDRALERVDAAGVTPLMEVTAGQGSYLGHRLEQLAEVFARVARPERLGVCLDTCHLFAAGYDIASAEGYARTLAELDRAVGLGRVKAIHLNDAWHGLGSHLDRHAPIGRGRLGLPTFRRIVRDRRFRALPLILETPGPLAAWRREIALLARLRS
jgi:deoxyribonuclease-4